MAAPVYITAPIFKINGTAYDIVDGNWKFDPEGNKIDTTSSFFPDYTMGNCMVSFVIKSNDARIPRTYYKWTEATNVELIFRRSGRLPGAETTPADYTFATGTTTYKITNCRITDAPDISGGADKKQSEFSMTFTAARKSDGTDPVVTVTYSWS